MRDGENGGREEGGREGGREGERWNTDLSKEDGSQSF